VRWRRQAALLQPAVAQRQRRAGSYRLRGRVSVARGVLALLIFLASLLFTIQDSLSQLSDHYTLAERGVVTVATVESLGPSDSVWVWITLPDGSSVDARVPHATVDRLRQVGEAIRVRYDPLDPAGRIEALDTSDSPRDAWIFLILGVLLLPVSAFIVWSGTRQLIQQRRDYRWREGATRRTR
jgi:hypothetical protein